MRVAVTGLALCVAAGTFAPGGAAAQIRRPDLLLPEPGRTTTRLSLGLDNDNLFFGLYRALNPTGDGDDTGRTHGLDLQLGVTRPDGLTFGVGLECLLFLTDNGRPRRFADEDGNFLYRDADGAQGYLVDDVFLTVDGRVVPRDELVKVSPRAYADRAGNTVVYRSRTFVYEGREVDVDPNTARRIVQQKNLPIDFRELTFLRFSVDDRATPRPLYWRASFGPVFVNGQRVTAGATGQQVVWHALIGWREYDYRASDAPNQFGVTGAGEVGVDHTLAELGGARLLLQAAGGAELATLPEANRAFARLHLGLEGGPVGAPWGELRVGVDADAWLALGEVTTLTRVLGAVHAGPLSVFLRLNLYAGGLANGWFVYNRNRPTTDGGIELRF